MCSSNFMTESHSWGHIHATNALGEKLSASAFKRLWGVNSQEQLMTATHTVWPLEVTVTLYKYGSILFVPPPLLYLLVANFFCYACNQRRQRDNESNRRWSSRRKFLRTKTEYTLLDHRRNEEIWQDPATKRFRRNNPRSNIQATGFNMYEGVSKSFRTESNKKYTLTTINTCWEATQRVMAAKLTHKIAIQLHLVAESCTICSSRSRWPGRKILDTFSYIMTLDYFILLR